MLKKRTIYLGISGISGRMGCALQKVVKEKMWGVCFIIRDSWSPHTILNKRKRIDGIVDFSAPNFFEQSLQWCLKNKKPFVSGTTGLSKKQRNLLKRVGKKIPIFYEENMSWGIWLIKNWMKSLSTEGLLSIDIEDIHHKLKKDCPSGTSLKLVRSFSSSLQKRVKVKSVRKGIEFGTHRIHLKMEEETIMLEHKALNRYLFAKGALKALRWLVFQSPGLYCLDDILNKDNREIGSKR